jgi:murein L,D-transpeptidase YafK
MSRARTSPVAAGLLALLVSPALARGADWRVLPAAQVFPPGEAASADTLDEPLLRRIEAWRARTGKRTFQKRIVVHKARRRLDVLADGEVLKSYVVELGLAPVGDKRARGDRRTPEGDLYVCAMNRASAFTRFVGLSYPTPAAAAAGVAEGRVAPGVARAVRAAYRTRDRCPPQATALGGAVGIHGKGEWERRPEGFAVVDWTWGCLGLRDADVLELFDHYAEVGVAVRIEPE